MAEAARKCSLRRTNRQILWICLLGWLGIVSCSTAKHTGESRNFTYSYCEPGHHTDRLVWADGGEQEIAPGRISSHDRILYRELGISSYINEALSLKGDSSAYARIRLLKQRISDRVSTAGAAERRFSAGNHQSQRAQDRILP